MFADLNCCFYKSLHPAGRATSKIYAFSANSNPHKFIHSAVVLFQFRINSAWLIASAFRPEAAPAFAEAGSLQKNICLHLIKPVPRKKLYKHENQGTFFEFPPHGITRLLGNITSVFLIEMPSCT